jgi:hypothetical protein
MFPEHEKWYRVSGIIMHDEAIGNLKIIDPSQKKVYGEEQ